MRNEERSEAKYFNSRPSARGDDCDWAIQKWLERFQFTPLREGRRYPIKPPASDSLFQFTPLREGRLQVLAANNVIVPISIHAPPRGATATLREASLPTSFQFTPLREGRRNQRQDGGALEYFNSRPSARGDRNFFEGGDSLAVHFNSRPSARGDNGHTYTVEYCLHFNSRPSARGDERPTGNYYGERSISIHAPPRGATR